MKILCLGCLHGKILSGLKTFVRKNKVEAILACGDYADADKTRKIIFKNWGENWWEVVGPEKAKSILKEQHKSGINVLRKFNSLGIPVYLVFGNNDFYRDYLNPGRKTEFDLKVKGVGDFEDAIKKSFKRIKVLHLKTMRLGGLKISGYNNYRGYGIKKDLHEEVPEDKKKIMNSIKKRIKKDFKKISDSDIIIAHEPPFGVRLDLIKNKSSPINGKHIGDDVLAKFARKSRWKMILCAHMHEHWGMDKIGKTKIVACGYGRKGQAVLVELPSLKVKKVKL